MNQKSNWKLLDLNADDRTYSAPAPHAAGNQNPSAAGKNRVNFEAAYDAAGNRSAVDTNHASSEASYDTAKNHAAAGSSYLIAHHDTESYQKDLLYKILGPIFFGEKQAESPAELAALFFQKYGIDVTDDFFEGDEHYEEYQEAYQAISEGMGIYGGSISFDNCILADLADVVWENMEQKGKEKFRRINTLLEE